MTLEEHKIKSLLNVTPLKEEKQQQNQKCYIIMLIGLLMHINFPKVHEQGFGALH